MDGMPLNIVTNYGEPWFRAYDKATGDVVWEMELEAGTTGVPMTYLHEGKQYVVVPDRRPRGARPVGGAQPAVARAWSATGRS